MADDRVTKPVAVYLTRNLAVGGAERVFVDYVRHARAASPVVALLERSGGMLSSLDGVAPIHARRTPDSETEQDWPGETFGRLALECRWLRELVIDADAQIVSSFLMRAHIVALLTKLLFLPRLPVVLNIHEHMTESADYLYPLRRDRAMMRWITRHLFARADRIVVVAEELKRDLVESFGVSPALVQVVHNPLDADRIRSGAAAPLSDRWTPAPGQQTVVGVGRLVWLKGYDLLIRAIAEVRETRDVRLVLVGEGDERASLDALAEQLGIREFVSFAGLQDNPWRFVAQADVLALTSRTEAFPSVLAESMLVGTPVLATDCTRGIHELLDDGRAGLIVPPEDPSAIAAGLNRLLGDAALRDRLRAAGQERVRAFDLDVAVRRYENILTELAAPRAT